MPWPQPIEEALARNTGARFFKVALQVNPHSYAEQYRGQAAALDEAGYVEGLAEAAIRNEIEALAITDHNHCGAVEGIAAVCAKHSIVVFPGFEASSKDGVHYLCLFEPGTLSETLNRVLGGLGIKDTSPNADLSSLSCRELTKAIHEADGVVVAAHATNDKGLLAHLKGKPCIQAWRDPTLTAGQIPGGVGDLREPYKKIVENRNAEYKREGAPEDRLAMAVVNARDVASPSDLDDSAASCWIKMTAPTVEGLKQAFLDPGSRIRLRSDPEPEDHARLVAVAWEGGFLDGQSIHFSENMNVLIGGRGAGKSTVLESVRYVLGLRPIGPDAKAAHDLVVKDVIQPGTKVSLLVHSPYPSPKHYLIERTSPNRPRVLDDAGDVVKVKPAELMPSIQVYGQHEIGELTRSKHLLGSLLERFVGIDPKLREEASRVAAELEENRTSIVSETKKRAAESRKMERLPALEERLKRFEAAGVNKHFKNKDELIRESGLLDGVEEWASELADNVRDALSTLEFEVDEVLSDEDLKNLPGRDLLLGLQGPLEKVHSGIAKHGKALARTVDELSKALAVLREKWTSERQEPVNLEFEQLLRKIQEQHVDAKEYVALRTDVEKLRPGRKRLRTLDKQLKRLSKDRDRLAEQWIDLAGSEFRATQKAAKSVNKRLKGLVRVSVAHAGDRRPLLELLRETVGGRLKEAETSIEEMDDLSLEHFVATCRSGWEQLVEHYDLTEHQALQIVAAGDELFMKIEELHLPDVTQVALNVAADARRAEWRPMARLSSGQKATAALLLLLLEADAPLLVDQPEDDLDNRFIADGIVPRLRSAKRRRQFLLSSHNANLPVLGDAELIVGMRAEGEAEGGSAEIPHTWSGSIDSPQIQSLVEEILEGGKRAFETRRRKYGF